MSNNPSAAGSSSAWTWIGLAIALLAIPILAAGVRELFGPPAAGIAVIRELMIFILTLFLLWIVRSKEKQPLASLGLVATPPGSFILWTLIGLVGCVLALAIGLVAVNLLGLRFGSVPGAVQVKLPMWVTIVVLLRAGIVEELFYRGYAIDRLQQVSASRAVAVVLPLLVFAGSHYGQGAGGVLVTFLLGAALTALYLWKRNLWVVMLVHFMVDFIPNVILPLLSGDS